MSDPSSTPPSSRPPDQGPPPDPGPPPSVGRVALLTGGLLLVVAGGAVRAYALARGAGSTGGNDAPQMIDPGPVGAPATTTAPGGRPATVAYRLESAGGRPVT